VDHQTSKAKPALPMVVAIQGDGKIVAAGSGFATLPNQNFTLVRYNSDGSLDQSFDGSSSNAPLSWQWNRDHRYRNQAIQKPIRSLSPLAARSRSLAMQKLVEPIRNAMALAQYNTTDGSLTRFRQWRHWC